MQRYGRPDVPPGGPHPAGGPGPEGVGPEPPVSLRLAPSPADESAIVYEALAGDAAARTWIVRTYTPIVHRFAVRLLANEEDALDATQETMVKVLRNLDRYDASWRFATWVFGIARNTCVDEHRRRRRRPTSPEVEVADPTDSPLERTEREHRAMRLLDALARLPPLYREVVLLYHFEHFKYREIADVLGLPLGTVMNRIFRARQKLRILYDATELETGASP